MAMKEIRRTVVNRGLLLAFVASAVGGCAFITPPSGGGAQMVSSASTDEAWYVKNRYFLGFPTSSDVYYCGGKGTCTKADVR